MFRKPAIVCVAAPLRIRLASSRSVPSRTPCRPFSIPQWPRVSPKSALAPPRSATHALDPPPPRGLAFLPRPPLPRQAVDLRAAGPVRTQVLAERRCDLDRPLLDPAVPLVDLGSPLDLRLAARRAAWRGGKAGLWLGEGGSDVLGQRRLVLLHRQDIITAPFDHGRADIPARENGIAGDDFALQRQPPQQLQRGLVLVGLGIHSELGQDRLDLRGVGGDQVDPGRVAIAAAPGGLAVDGDVGSVARPESPLDPLPDPRLQAGDVNRAETPTGGRL